MINKHKSNKIKENSDTVRHLNNGTDHRHSKSSCDQSSPARRTMNLKNGLVWRGAELCVNDGEMMEWQAVLAVQFRAFFFYLFCFSFI